MIHLDFKVLIDRPVEQVFAFISTLTNLPRWQSMISDVRQVSPGPIGVDSTFSVSAELMGHRMDSLMRVTTFEPAKSFGFEGKSGPMHIRALITFKPAGTGTQLTLSGDSEPGGLFKIAEGVLVKQVRSQMEDNLSRLKAVLEAEG